jgi:hypothetical protein
MIPTRWRTEFEQARTIARATFDGFLQSDLMPSGMQAPAIIWAAAFLVAPALVMPAQHMVKYPLLRRFHPELVEPMFWSDRLLFLLMSAGAVGLVSVVLWDTLFPARRDAFVLTPMPVSLPVQMLGRLGGLLTLCVVFIVALNAVPAMAFPIASSAGFAQMPRGMVGHIVAASLSNMFVFFSVTSLQGIVILSLGKRTASRFASMAQAGAVLLILLSLLFFGAIRELTRDAFVRGAANDPVLLFMPTAWFLGLYEFIAGSARPLMATLAARAVLAALLPVAITVAIYTFGYKRLLARAVETPPRSTRSFLLTLTSRIVRTVFVRRPEEQAICAFLLRAISRSGRHSMLMSIYIGAGLALMVTFVLPDILRLGADALTTPSVAALALPLVLSVALGVGARILITIPADMGARWVFQTTSITPRRVDAAVHKALLLLVVPTVMAVAALTAGPLWGRVTAAQHAAYCGALSILLCEMLLIGYRGIPLTRPYVPGGSRFHMLWAVYLFLFSTYTFTAARLERDLMRHGGTRGIAIAASVFAGLAFALWVWRKLKVRQWTDIPFEAAIPDDQMFQGFNLSEIQAAQAVASHANGHRSNSV